MRLKQILPLLSSLIFIALTIPSCTNIGTETYKQIKIPYEKKIYDSAVLLNGIYASTGDSIVFFYLNGQKKKEFNIKAAVFEKIAVYKDLIYAYDSAEKSIREFNADGKEKSKFKITIDFSQIDKIDVYKRNLFVKTDKGIIYTNMDDGKAELLDINDVAAFTTYNDSEILCHVSSQKRANQLIKYNFKSRQAAGEMLFPYMDVNDMSFDEKANQIFFVSDDIVYSCPIDSTFNGTILGQFSQTKVKIKAFDKYAYCFNTNNPNIIDRLPQSPKNGPVVGENTIIVLTPVDDSLKGYMRKKHNINVVSASSMSTNDTKFVTKVLSGSTEFDVFRLGTNSPVGYSLLKNKFYVDLGLSNTIRRYVDSMYPIIKDSSMYDGKLFGLPFMITMPVIYCDKERLSENGFSMDDLSTWKSIMGIMDKYDGRNMKGKVYAYKSWINSTLLTQYVMNCVKGGDPSKAKFDSGRLKEALLYMKRLNDSQGIFNDYAAAQTAGWFGSADPLKEDGIIAFEFFHDFSSDVRNGYLTKAPSVLPLPALYKDDKATMPLDMTWLAINPLSKKKDMAMKFLEECTSFKDGYKSNSGYSEGFIERTRKLLIPSEETSEEYKELLKSSSVSFDIGLYMNTAKTVLPDYLNGNITVDEAVEKMMGMIDMMVNE